MPVMEWGRGMVLVSTADGRTQGKKGPSGITIGNVCARPRNGAEGLAVVTDF